MKFEFECRRYNEDRTELLETKHYEEFFSLTANTPIIGDSIIYDDIEYHITNKVWNYKEQIIKYIAVYNGR